MISTCFEMSFQFIQDQLLHLQIKMIDESMKMFMTDMF